MDKKIEVGHEEVIDGYRVKITQGYNDKSKFYYTVNGNVYNGSDKNTPEAALKASLKTIEARKKVDATMNTRRAAIKGDDIQASITDKHFKQTKKSGNPISETKVIAIPFNVPISVIKEAIKLYELDL